MGIVHRWHHTNNTSTSRIYMTEIITQSLDIVNREFIFVDEDGIMRWTRSPLQSRMGQQKEIIELRMCDISVHDSASRTIARAIRISTFSGEETSMMTFGDDDKCDVGTVTFFEGLACRTNGFDFSINDVGELSFRNAVAEKQHSFGFGFGLLVECLRQIVEGIP